MHICIIGCGQLARMMALAGKPLGLSFSFLDDNTESNHSEITKHAYPCVFGLGDIIQFSPDTSSQTLYKQLKKPDVITVEKEQVSIDLLDELSQYCMIRPCIKAIAIFKNRFREKQFLSDLEIPSAPYRFAYSSLEVRELAIELGLPVFVKSTDEGYDGKNQYRIKSVQDLDNFMLQQISGEWLIEKEIPFQKEVSFIATRSSKGDIVFYSPTENQHKDGILISSIAPALDLSTHIISDAQNYLKKAIEEVNYIGTLSMECFIHDNKVLVNEFAPRVHNSGHWTIDGAVCSQFENHLRAITDLPIGSTNQHSYTGMINLLGTSKPPLTLLSSNSKLYWYEKEPRPGRKLGHINVIANSQEEVASSLTALSQLHS